MINKIGIKNFRVFKDYTEFELRPITLLTGPNNSGKSSFTKLLLLLKNGVTSLNFEEGEHNLTNYEDVLNWNLPTDDGILHSLEVTFTGVIDIFNADIKTSLVYGEEGYDIIEFKIEIDNMIIYSCSFEDVFDGPEHADCNRFYETLDTNELINLIKNYEILFDSQPLNNFSPTSLGVTGLSSLNLDKLNYYRELIVSKKSSNINNEIDLFLDAYQGDYDVSIGEFRAACNFFNLSSPLYYMNTKLKGFLFYNDYKQIKEADNVMFELFLNDSNITNKYKDYLKPASIWNEGEPIIGYYYSLNDQDILNDLKNYEKNFQLSGDIVNSIKENLKKHFSEKDLEKIEIRASKLNKFIFHKSPLLNNKSLWETMVSNYSNIDQCFKHINYIRANRSEQNRVVFFKSKKEAYSSFFIEKEKKYLNEIKDIFELPGEIKIKELEHSVYGLYLDDTNLADLGFGFSQLIPIILKIIHSPENTSLIVEEPEANLHPKLQSKLADFFAVSQKYYPKIHFIIETHSEYFIRKLQYLTAKGETQTEDAIIYYFNDDKYVTEKEPKVKSIEINKDGSLSDNFGPGFYDEITRLQFDLIKLNNPQKN